tara:strand:- start:8409 stop:8534 length:126 start_codon:yes stop_codon:yes gene_type:complete
MFKGFVSIFGVWFLTFEVELQLVNNTEKTKKIKKCFIGYSL